MVMPLAINIAPPSCRFWFSEFWLASMVNTGPWIELTLCLPACAKFIHLRKWSAKGCQQRMLSAFCWF